MLLFVHTVCLHLEQAFETVLKEVKLDIDVRLKKQSLYNVNWSCFEHTVACANKPCRVVLQLYVYVKLSRNQSQKTRSSTRFLACSEGISFGRANFFALESAMLKLSEERRKWGESKGGGMGWGERTEKRLAENTVKMRNTS